MNKYKALNSCPKASWTQTKRKTKRVAKIEVNTLEPSYLQTMWEFVKGIDDNKRLVSKARVLQIVAFWEGKEPNSRNEMIEVYRWS